MQTLTLRSFGPIREADLPVRDIVILNGPQASGKSTLSKAIFFFKSLPDVLFQAIYENTSFLEAFEKNLAVTCRRQLISIFGPTRDFDDFRLHYSFSPKKSVTITREERSGHARVAFSGDLRNALREAAVGIRHLRGGGLQRNWRVNYMVDKLLHVEKRQQLSLLNQTIRETFAEPRQPLFIPAGRSIVSTLSGELKTMESVHFDYLLREFVRRIFYQREFFSKDLEEIVEDREKLTTAPIDFQRVNPARKLVERILRGRYRYENGEERILLDDRRDVKLQFASSGQQESLWILLLFFMLILNGEDGFVVVEEPEAHLFPEAQYEMMKLMGIFAGKPGNQIVATTHSPYIMAAVNNLLLADQASRHDSGEASRILPDVCRLDPARTSAYFVENGGIQSILDEETGMIDPGFLDAASERINSDFESLLGLETVS